ncbi:MAG: hypothetical protein JXN59_07950 [Anaerolineae bacterium]|nr:hypothetical protein [Anaerolineae bacterium]
MSALYDRPSDGRYYCPIQPDHDPMKGLFLINIRQGRHYKGIEPQWFDDPVNGQGMLVLAYQLDGTIDVYYEPTLTIDHRDINIEGGEGERFVTIFERSHFATTPAGVDLDIAFRDKAGRRIEARIRETLVKPRQPFTLLAPAGAGIKTPTFLPLFMMYDFHFIRRKGTEVRISVDDEPCRLFPMPVPMGGEWVYSLRFPGEPLIISLNPAGERALPALTVEGRSTVTEGTLHYDFTAQDGHPELARLGVDDGRHAVTFAFEPPLPDAACLRDGAAQAGRFIMTSAPDAGTLGGEYSIRRAGDEVTATLWPSEGWTPPAEAPFMARLIFNLLPMFRRWPKTYHWTGRIRLGAGEPRLESRWERRQG